MLDMSFQILFFFILNFHPPMNEGEIVFIISSGGESEMNKPIGMSTGDEVKLIIKSSDTPEHSLTGWEIATKVSTQSFPVAPDGVDATLAKVEEALKRMEKIKADPSINMKATTLTVELDGKLRYSDVIDCMNVGKKAGFETISMNVKGGGG